LAVLKEQKMSKIDRITLESSYHAGEWSLDGNPVSGFSPLDEYDGKIKFVFRAGPLDGEMVPSWIAYTVVDYLTGSIHYTQNEEMGFELSRKIALAYLTTKA